MTEVAYTLYSYKCEDPKLGDLQNGYHSIKHANLFYFSLIGREIFQLFQNVPEVNSDRV